jgi:raffinose/stachyose/melibiose transport system permease protein
MHKVLSNKWVIFSLVFPGILLFVLAFLTPVLLSVYYGMTNSQGGGVPYSFIGFDNFRTILFDDPTFWKSLKNALFLGIGYVLIQHPFCIFFAILIDRVGGKSEKWYRALFFIPCVISVVVTSKMWINILDPDFGLLNKVLDKAGLGILKHAWLSDPHTALLSILFIVIWQGFGWGMLFYYAGLKGISEEIYEAAKIDGASGFKLHLKITVPLLNPIIKVNVTLALITAFKQMETIYLTTNGGPGDHTQFLANYLYTKAFSANQYGYANAISVLFVLSCLLVTFITNRAIKTNQTA